MGTHVWIVDAADDSFRSIKDEEGGQVSSVASDNNHGKPSPHHTEHTGAETAWSAWINQIAKFAISETTANGLLSLPL